jgi:hypothetical protein
VGQVVEHGASSGFPFDGRKGRDVVYDWGEAVLTPLPVGRGSRPRNRR